jgi:hypothetical protein|tara:strand:- start:3 stop:602 length:600 start_codon:yes stop_codon:yes gene_type:complete
MYKIDQLCLSDMSYHDSSATKWIIGMVLLSIQQQWSTVGVQLSDLKENGIESKYLFSHKKAGWDYVLANLKNIQATIHSDKISIEEKLLELAGIPNIGLVKAGFILQICIGEVGCLDVHNLNRFGLSASTFKLAKNVTYATALKKAKLYVKLCKDLGGSEYLWDSWCNYVATKYPKVYDNGDHVSKLHLEYVECNLKKG